MRDRGGSHEQRRKPPAPPGDTGTEDAAADRDERLLSVAEVASYLGVPVKTLYQWRHKGVGPRAMRVGRHLRYRRSELERWLDGLDGGQAGGTSQR